MGAGRIIVGEFAFPGPLRDQLVAAILAGAKTTTTGLVSDYEIEGEPLPRPGDREVVIDSAGEPVTLIEITAVRVLRLADVDLAHALGEGEGYATVAEWRTGHESFWHSEDMRAWMNDPAFTVTDDTPVVAIEFRVVPDHGDLAVLLRQARNAVRLPGLRVTAGARSAPGGRRRRAQQGEVSRLAWRVPRTRDDGFGHGGFLSRRVRSRQVPVTAGSVTAGSCSASVSGSCGWLLWVIVGKSLRRRAVHHDKLEQNTLENRPVM